MAGGTAWGAESPDSPLDPENFKGPVCFIAGSLKPVSRTEENSFTGMIRLRFDARNLAHCKLMVSRHCRNKWLKIGYVPEKIEGHFRADSSAKTREEFTMSTNCSISP